MKKVRFVVSDFMREILESDSEYFRLPVGKIGNRLLKYYVDKDISKISLENSSGKIIQFNLTKKNEDIFFDILREKEVETDAELMRNIFFTYINNLRFKREEIIFEETFNKIKQAIIENKKVSIKYHNVVRIVNPYFIDISSKENRAYLFCYCEKNEDYRNYRISEIDSIWLLSKELERKDKDYIEAIRRNFDPFLTYGNRVKVRMSDEAKELFERVTYNRPRVIEENGNEFILECNSKLAKVYFAQFYDEVEILEPKELREEMKQILERSLKKYKK